MYPDVIYQDIQPRIKPSTEYQSSLAITPSRCPTLIQDDMAELKATPAELQEGTDLSHSTTEDVVAAQTPPHSNSPEKTSRVELSQWLDEKFDWSWFTATQSTGGFAIALAECPKQFHGLQTIGTIVFIANLILFLAFNALMIMRFSTNPGRLRRSLTVAPECFFFGSYWLTIAGIIMCMQRYGVPHVGDWLLVVVRVLFWTYAAVTFLSTSLHFVVVFKYTTVSSIDMSPAWFFLIFNSMLTGTVAASIAPAQPPDQRWPIIIAGVAYQGLGWLVSMLILGWFLGRMMEKGWPEPSNAPSLFITIGTAGYTVVALIGCAQAIPDGYGYFEKRPMAPEILRIVATWVGIFMWLFNFWLFCIAFLITTAGSVRRREGQWVFPMSFNNGWWGESTTCGGAM